MFEVFLIILRVVMSSGFTVLKYDKSPLPVAQARPVLRITEARRADPLTSRAEVYLRIRKSHPKPWCSRNKMNCVCIMYNFGLLLLKLSTTPASYTSSVSCSYNVHDLSAVQSRCSFTRLSGIHRSR
jgi:hypothetical protein